MKSNTGIWAVLIILVLLLGFFVWQMRHEEPAQMTPADESSQGIYVYPGDIPHATSTDEIPVMPVSIGTSTKG